MGLAIGAGFYECVFLGTVLIFLSMRYLPIVENMMVEHAPFLNIYVEFESLDHIGDVIGRIKEQNAQVLDVEVDHGRGPGSSNPFPCGWPNAIAIPTCWSPYLNWIASIPWKNFKGGRRSDAAYF